MKKAHKILLALSVTIPLLAYAASNSTKITEKNGYRYIESNGYPDDHGSFPNHSNPNSISAQNYNFRIPLSQKKASTVTPYGHNLFGVTLKGIPFDPGTAEFWNNDFSSGWNYEALSGAINLGVDKNNAHVQPNGAYHYHGLPTDMIKTGPSEHSNLIGYAADGFPIYALYGYNKNGKIKKLHPSYRIKQGTRPTGPGGKYDGTFVQDYEYIENLGDLDECNGQTGSTPEYPDGIYHYFITDTYPFVPRCHMGKADQSFAKSKPLRNQQGNSNTHRRPPHSRRHHPPPHHRREF